MTELKRFTVSYPNGLREILAEDHIDARERAQERWGTAPTDVWEERKRDAGV